MSAARAGQMTRQMTTPDAGSGLWLRLLLHALVAADHMTPIAEGALAWNVTATKRRATAHSRFGAGLHSHANLELCAAVRGRSIMDIGDRRHRLVAPALTVFAPGVMHSEGFAQQRHSYATVWISLSRQRSLYVHAAHYRPGRGWICPWSGTIPEPEHRRMMPWFLEPGALTPTWFEGFRAHLLAALGALARQTHGQSNGSPAPQAASAGHLKVLHWVRHYLDRHYAQPFTLDQIAAMTRYSPNYLDALFSHWTGKGIRRYVIAQRMEQAMRLCRTSSLPIQTIARRVGYDDPLYFSRAFRRYHGCSPTEARS